MSCWNHEGVETDTGYKPVAKPRPDIKVAFNEEAGATKLQTEVDRLTAAIEVRGYLVELAHEPAFSGSVPAGRGRLRSVTLPAQWVAKAVVDPPTRGVNPIQSQDATTILQAVKALHEAVEAHHDPNGKRWGDVERNHLGQEVM